MSDRVTEYYDNLDEWQRLDTPAGQIEFERTLKFVSDRLASCSVVLDLGGGPGRYALALAASGHRVSLVDPSSVQIEAARERAASSELLTRIPTIEVASAQNLSQFDESAFDSVLALGPFYHLPDSEARLQAARELYRVTKAGGLVFVAFIPRLSGLAGLIERAARDPAQVPTATLARARDSGAFINGTPRGFQDGYYPNTAELEALFSSVGFAKEDLLSIRSLWFGREIEALELRQEAPDLAQAFDALCDDVARDRGVIAHCGHALLVLSKPTPDAAQQSAAADSA